jgi:hypothetical protein
MSSAHPAQEIRSLHLGQSRLGEMAAIRLRAEFDLLFQCRELRGWIWQVSMLFPGMGVTVTDA